MTTTGGLPYNEATQRLTIGTSVAGLEMTATVHRLRPNGLRIYFFVAGKTKASSYDKVKTWYPPLDMHRTRESRIQHIKDILQEHGIDETHGESTNSHDTLVSLEPEMERQGGVLDEIQEEGTGSMGNQHQIEGSPFPTGGRNRPTPPGPVSNNTKTIEVTDTETSILGRVINKLVTAQVIKVQADGDVIRGMQARTTQSVAELQEASNTVRFMMEHENSFNVRVPQQTVDGLDTVIECVNQDIALLEALLQAKADHRTRVAGMRKACTVRRTPN